MQDKAAVVIVAAGASHRMQGYDKLWSSLYGRIVLARTVDAFHSSPFVQTIILVVHPQREADARLLHESEEWQKVAAILSGGPRRQDSVRIGLEALGDIDPQCQWVIIHDGARPLMPPSLVEDGLRAVQLQQAVTAAVPVKETMKQVEQGLISSTLDRSRLWSIQTPQAFSFPLLWKAHHTSLEIPDVTDDAMLLQRLGHPVTLFLGSYMNIKITTQDDFLLAEALLQGHTLT